MDLKQQYANLAAQLGDLMMQKEQMEDKILELKNTLRMKVQEIQAEKVIKSEEADEGN